MDMQAPDEETMVKVAVADLDDRFESIDRSKIETTVRRLVHELFTRSRVKSFVGILAERRARAELRRIAVEPTRRDRATGIEPGERRV
jgi:hypothetical protein